MKRGVIFAVAAWMACGAAAAGEVQEKAPMYSYQTIWTLPRARWPQMQQAVSADRPILDRVLEQGALIAYGNDINPIHTADGWTQVTWWAGPSLTGLFKVVDALASQPASSSVLTAAIRQQDGIYISRYYNWWPGAYDGLFTYIGIYKLRADAPPDAVATLSKDSIVPLLEMLLADRTLVEYEIDEEVFHTAAPRTFFVNYMALSPESLLKANGALADRLDGRPVSSAAASHLIDTPAYRGSLSRTLHATFK